MSEELWRVAVDAPISEPLTYVGNNPAFRGQIVEVPLGKRTVSGVLIGRGEKIRDVSLKNISDTVSGYPILPEPYLKWIEWLSQYYLHPIGQVAALALPPLAPNIKARKNQDSIITEVERKEKPELTDEQRMCFEKIKTQQGFGVHLVFGVTGSGKTEIYLRLLEEVIKSNKVGMVLVPEISLTPQLTRRFTERFGDQVAVIHSHLTDRQRTNQWWSIVKGEKKILVGARSALFCPIENLGIVIVDEEHEPSFKQEEKLKYHGRDAAVMLGKFHDCKVILGSATPSLETWHNAQVGKYSLYELKARVQDRAMPSIEVVDLRQVKEAKKDENILIPRKLPFWLSEKLYTSICETLEAGDQAALFLNRRGMAQMIICEACGHTRECPNCDINLTLHGKSYLVCHYCDYHENLQPVCKDCKEGEMKKAGIGTELIEADLRELFPDKIIARADRDEISSREDMENLVSDMESGKINILIGTQMIAKGLDFPKLKLVGLVLADIGFNMPDFRCTERSFQLITQMSGRSGRHIKVGESPGKVIIQAYNTEHESIKFAMEHNFVGFAQSELMNREALKYPPFGKLVSFRIQGAKLLLVESTAQKLSARLKQMVTQFPTYKDIEVLGPAESPLSRIRNQFRYQILVKGSTSNILNHISKQALGDENWIDKGIKVLVDIDPIQLL